MLRPVWIVHKCPAEKTDVDFSWKRACAREFESGYQKHSENFSKKKDGMLKAQGAEDNPRTTRGTPMLGRGTPILGRGTPIPGHGLGDHTNLKSVLFFFDGCLFWLLAVCLCPASMSKHEVGFAHTNEIACKKQSRLCRGWFTAYTYGLKGLSAYTGKPWTPIQGFHESLYWENCSPIPGKHPGIASKTPV